MKYKKAAKTLALSTFTFATLFANAQKVNLEVGKTFKVTTNVESTSEMMGNENSQKIVINNTYKINSIEKEFYKGTNTITRMTMSGTMMGQDINFDSDKKADMEGQIGQMLGSKVNKESNFTLDKNTGAFKITDEKEEEGMGDMFGGGSNANSGLIYVDAIGKKVGDKWTTTNDADGIKTTSNYEVKSINGNVMTIALSGTTKGTTTKEMQGQSMEQTLDSKNIGTLTIDALTGILKSMTADTDGNMSIDAGGQSMVVASKSKITMTVE